MMALPGGALLLPGERAMLVADLHLEKASHYALGGQMLPPYDSRATLDRIAGLIAVHDVAAVYCLGDSFHDAGGMARLEPIARAQLEALTASLRWTWIVGNHDPALTHGFGGVVTDQAMVAGLVLRHAADPADSRPEVSGHFHPRFRVRQRGRHIARRCFVAGPHKLVLPAFGVLTGGMDAADPAVIAAVGAPSRALVPVGGRMLAFPLTG